MKCQLCGGPGVFLGALGLVKHYRCRNCGMGYCRLTKRRKKKGA